MSGIIERFRSAMADAGIIYSGDISANSGLIRVKGDNHKNGKNIAYKLNVDGKGAGGFFQDWTSETSGTWTDKDGAYRMTKADYAAIDAEKKARAAELEAQYKAAAVLANKAWEAGNRVELHPYCIAKNVPIHGARVNDKNELMIPVYNRDGGIQSLQCIAAKPDKDGRWFKKNFTDAKMSGGFWWIGEATDTIMICEGFATAATLHAVYGYRVVIAFGCHNLVDVAVNAVRYKYPSANIIIAGDNNANGIGQRCANAAADACGGSVLIPDREGYDWNDHYNDLPKIAPEIPKPKEPEVKEGFLVSASDTGGLKLLAESFGTQHISARLKNKLAYCQESGSWHEYTGTYWAIDELYSAKIYRLIKIGASTLGFENKYLNNIIKMLVASNSIPFVEPDNAVFIPFLNGLLDIKTRELTPHHPQKSLSWCIPYTYDDSADCPNIKGFLWQSCGQDSEIYSFLRAWLAALLHGRYDLQIFLHLLGKPGTGKGTFIRLCTELVGSRNVASTSMQVMAHDKFEIESYLGKRLVVVADNTSYVGGTEVFNNLTGGDALRIERKNVQKKSTFVYKGMVLIASNEHLQTSDKNAGLNRRRRTVKFDSVVPASQKQEWDKLGGESVILHSEMPGLINWLLELSRDDVNAAIHNPPTRVLKENLEAMAADNPLVDWFLASVVPSDSLDRTAFGCAIKRTSSGSETSFDDSDHKLYPSYLLYCQRHNKMPISQRVFRDKFESTADTVKADILIVRDRVLSWCVVGVRLRHEWEDCYSWAL